MTECLSGEKLLKENMANHLGGHFGFTAMVTKTFDFIVEKYNIKSVLDIGCGPAGMVEYANFKGIYSVGVDGDPDLEDKPYVTKHDFTIGELTLDKSFDLVYSTEFAEHVKEEYVKNFMPLFQKGNYVFISAAPPGQGGHHHVNCKNKEYWIKKFEEYGFEYLNDESSEIAKTSNDNVVKDNSMFFRNKNQQDTSGHPMPYVIVESTINSSVESYLKNGGVRD